MLINSCFPVLFIIFIGWLLAKFKIATAQLSQQVMLFVFWVSAPALIFNTINHYSSEYFLSWKYITAYLLVTALTILITYIVFKYIFRLSHIESIFAGYCGSVKNCIMIGYPMLYGIFGSRAALPMAISVIIFNVLLTPLLLYCIEISKYRQNSASLYSLLAIPLMNTSRNPLVIAAILGCVTSYFSISIPNVIKISLAYCSHTFVPLALCCIGIDIALFKKSKSIRSKEWVLTFICLIVCPILSIIIGLSMRLNEFFMVSLVILSSAPVAKSLYVYSKKYQFLQDILGTVILMTTLLGLVTMIFSMLVLEHYGIKI